MEKVSNFLKEIEDKNFKIDKDAIMESFKKGFFTITNKKIEHFPSSVFIYLNDEKIQLKEINFSNNEIKEISKSLFEIPNLTSLSSFDLSYNFLQTIPKEFSNLTNLNRIIMLGNHLKDFPET